MASDARPTEKDSGVPAAGSRIVFPALVLLHLLVVLIPVGGTVIGLPSVVWLQLLVVAAASGAMRLLSARTLGPPPGS